MEKYQIDLGRFSCPNPACNNYAILGNGNIAIRGSYGKDNAKPLLYCRTCGKRFATTVGTALYGAHLPVEIIHDIIHHAAEGVGVRATARLLGLDKDTVNEVILRIGSHCAKVLDGLLRSLSLTEVQLDELWSFVKKKKVMSLLKSPTLLNLRKISSVKETTSDEPGSGQQ